MFSTFSSRKSCPLWNNVEEYDGAREPQMTTQYGAYALHDGYASIHVRARIHKSTRFGTRTHTLSQTRNPYCLSTARMVRERASVPRYTCIACIVCSQNITRFDGIYINVDTIDGQKGTAFSAPIFTKLAVAQGCYVRIAVPNFCWIIIIIVIIIIIIIITTITYLLTAIGLSPCGSSPTLVQTK